VNESIEALPSDMDFESPLKTARNQTPQKTLDTDPTTAASK